MLYADGTLSPDQCGEINAAVRRANQARLQRWNALALKVWPAPSTGRPDGDLLRAALGVFNQVKLVAAVERQRPMTASEVRQVGERHAYLLDPQPDPVRRHAGTFFELLQAMAHHHRVPSAIQSLRKMTHRGSWLQALAPHYARYLLGQPLQPAEVMTVLRRHSARKGVDDMALPSVVADELTARWTTLKGQLTWNTQMTVHLPVDPARTVSTAIFEELLRALAQPVPAAQSATVPPGLAGSVPPRPDQAMSLAGSPPRQVQPSGSAQRRPPLPSAAIPQDLRALVQARPAMLEAVSPKLRLVLKTALQDDTPVTPGQLQLLNLTVRTFQDRAWPAFVNALADVAADLGQRRLARELVSSRRVTFWRAGLGPEFAAYLRGDALERAAVRRAEQLLDSDTPSSGGRPFPVVTLPADQRRARDFLDALAAVLRPRGDARLADRLADPACEARWLALLPAAWRSFQADGEVTESMVTAVRARGSAVD